MNTVKICLKHQFEWMKNDFYLLTGLIFSSALAISYFKIHEAIGILILVVLFIRTIMFINLYSLRSNDGNSFSWKFIMGLPLSKNEILLLNISSGLLVASPLFLLLIAYWRFLSKTIFDNPHSLSLTLVNSFLCFIFIYLFSTKNLIEYPRKEYQRKKASNQLIKFLRNLAVVICVLFYVIIASDWIYTHYDLNLWKHLEMGIKFIIDVITSWWSVPLWGPLIIYMYFITLKIWNNEKLSYKLREWRPVREYSTIAVSAFLLGIGIINTDFKTPSAYQGDLNKLVFQKNMTELNKKLGQVADLNFKNEYGFTPMLVAINEGNVEMVKFLESKGLSFQGTLTKKHVNVGYDSLMLAVNSGKVEMVDYLVQKKFNFNLLNKEAGLYPIHLAASKCDSKMVDHLLQAGAEVNSLNSKGETPLIVATKKNCLAVAFTLKEAGANFDIKDKSAKVALDHYPKDNKNYYREFRYFLEKNTRVPASQK